LNNDYKVHLYGNTRKIHYLIVSKPEEIDSIKFLILTDILKQKPYLKLKIITKRLEFTIEWLKNFRNNLTYIRLITKKAKINLALNEQFKFGYGEFNF
jgi:predicted transcriptional regulator